MLSAGDIHFHHSTLRERIIEHIFIGDVLRHCWQTGATDIEVLRSEFDSGGYDVVVGLGSTLRHIQLKSKLLGGRTTAAKINLRLMNKPSGCVIWIVVDESLKADHYLWFGAEPGAPLPDIGSMAIAKHTKATSEGVKNERPEHRLLKRWQFERLDTLSEVMSRLFGAIAC